MRTLYRLVALGAALFTAGGCQAPSHSEAKQLAEQRWKEVRAGVKLQLARQQYEGRRFEDVVQSATESIALDARRVEPYVLLAQASLELSKPASAEQALDAARRAGLDSADLHYMRGVIFEQRNDIQAAVDEFARARTMNPNKVEYVIAHAECLVALDRPSEALVILDESLHRFDDNGTIAVLAGRVATLLGDWEGAASRLGQASVLLNSSPIVAEELGLLYVRIGRCEEAVALLRPLIESAGESESASVRRGIAACYLALGVPALAKEVLIDYARLHVADGPAQLVLAKAALETNDLLTAARAIDLAEQAAPGRGETALVRAAVQWRRREYGSAAETLYGLLERDPANVEAYCLLSEVLRSQGQADAARDCLERALQIDPSCTLARQALVYAKNRVEPLASSAESSVSGAPAGGP